MGRWLLTTTVDPAAYVRSWLEDEDDPLDHSVVGLLGDRVVGTCTLGVRDAMGQPGAIEPHRAAQGSIGFTLDPARHEQGYATELVRAMLDVAFGEVGLHRVTGGCFADNIGSWRVMEKCGMRREQHGIQDSWHAEFGWLDGFTYAMLRTDWLRLRDA